MNNFPGQEIQPTLHRPKWAKSAHEWAVMNPRFAPRFGICPAALVCEVERIAALHFSSRGILPVKVEPLAWGGKAPVV